MLANHIWFLIPVLFLSFIHQLNAQVIVSEVYANADGDHRDQGFEWFEVYNIGSTPVDLANAIVRRLDGVKKEEAWRIQLPNAAAFLAPQEYAIIAQKKDLGIDICLDVLTIMIADPSFSFKNSGTQTICFQAIDNQEDCAPFNNSAVFPDGHSRYNRAPTFFANDDLKWWNIEDCEIMPNIYASPGTRGGFCHSDSMPLPHKIACPMEKTVTRTTISQDKSLSCQCTSSQPQKQFGLGGIFFILLFMLIRPKTNRQR